MTKATKYISQSATSYAMLELLELGKSPPDRLEQGYAQSQGRQRSPEPYTTISTSYLTQVALPHTKQITTGKYYTLSSTNNLQTIKLPRGQLDPLGAAHVSNGTEVAQSPGDSNSRGLNFATNNYTKNPFPRETIKARALTSWGFVTCCGLRVLRALRVLGRWWFSWATAGARPCATLNSSNSSRRFSSTLTCSLAPAKEDDVLPCPHFYSAPSPREPST